MVCHSGWSGGITTTIDVQVERIAFMKDRVEPLTGGFGLREFHKVKCVGKIGKGCGSEDKKRGFLRPGDLCQVLDRVDTQGRGTRSIVDVEHSRACRQFTGRPGHVLPGGCNLVEASQALRRSPPVRSGPGRRMRKGELVRSRTVDSRPRVVGPAVEDQVDPAVQVGQDVLGPGRRDPVRAIRAGGGERLARRVRSGRGPPPGPGLAAPTVSRPPVTRSGIRLERGRTSVSGPGQNRPARRSGALGPVGDALPSPGRSRHVDDQGIEGGPALGLEDPGDGGGVGRDRAQAVDGLGGERDQPAASQDPRGLVEQRSRRAGRDRR